MKRFGSVVALAVIFGFGGTAAANAAPLSLDRKAVVKQVVTPTEKERSVVLEKER